MRLLFKVQHHHSSQSRRQELEVAGHITLTVSREHGVYALSTLPLFHSLQNSSHEMVQPTNRMCPPTSMNVIKITLSSQAWLREEFPGDSRCQIDKHEPPYYYSFFLFARGRGAASSGIPPSRFFICSTFHLRKPFKALYRVCLSYAQMIPQEGTWC